MSRRITTILVVFCIALLTTSLALADVQLGKVKTALEGQLVITDDAGAEHTYSPQRDTRITLNGTKVKLDQLMPGFDVTVTTEKNGASEKVVSIEAESKNESQPRPITVAPSGATAR